MSRKIGKVRSNLRTRLPRFKDRRPRALSSDDFQRRILAALEKPTKNRLLVILNSAFFLWILSAIAIALGGAFFTTRQKCNADSEQLLQLDSHLDIEIQQRRAALRTALFESASVEALKNAVRELPHLLSEFKEQSLIDLVSKKSELWIRADLEGSKLDPSGFETIDQLVIYLTTAGSKFDAGQANTIARAVLADDVRKYENRIGAAYFGPNCGILAIFRQMINGDNKVLTVHYSIPLYGLFSIGGKIMPMSDEMLRQEFEEPVPSLRDLMKQIDPVNPVPLNPPPKRKAGFVVPQKFEPYKD